MAAPTGVNEELPAEPAKAGAEPAEAALAEAEKKAAPAGVVPAEAVPAQAGPAAEERVAAEPADTVQEEQAAAGPADTAQEEQAATGPAETGAAEAGPTGAGPAEAERAEAEPAEAEPAEAEPAETGEPEWRAEDERRDVSPLAVVGIIFGVIALVGAAVGVLAVVTHGFRPKTMVTYQPAAVFGLRPGQCVNSGSNALKVTVLSCARSHDAEVFAVFTLPAADWPGTEAVMADASDGCANRFGSYIDPQLATASLTQEYVYPNEAAWLAGERTVVCEVRAVSGKLTGSVRAKG